MFGYMDDYLEILNSYIKVGRDKKSYNIVGGTESIKDLNLLLDSFWLREKEKVTKEIKKFDGIKCYNCEPFVNPTEFVKRASLYSDLIIFRDWNQFFFQMIVNNPSKISQTDMIRLMSEDLSGFFDLHDWMEEKIVVVTPGYSNNLSKKEDKNTFRSLVEEDLSNDFLQENLPNHELFNDITEESKRILPEMERLSPQEITNATIRNQWVSLIDHLIVSGEIGAYPSTDNDFTWRSLSLKNEMDGKTLGKDALVSTALSTANVEFLNNVDLDFAKKVRDDGYLVELRSFFKESFNEIYNATDKMDFDELVRNYSTEINDRVKRHENELKSIKEVSKRKSAGMAGLALAGGSIAGAATYGLSIPSWVGVMGGVAGGFGFKDVAKEIMNYRGESKKNQHNGINLLFQLKQK